MPSLHRRGHLDAAPDGCAHGPPETFPNLDQLLGYDMK